MGVEVSFHLLGLNVDQVIDRNLPTRPHKRGTTADQRWPHEFACELDALPPDDLRAMVRWAIEAFLPRDELNHLKVIEAHERSVALNFIGAG